MNVPWYLMAKGKGGGGYKTASGPIVNISDAVAASLRSLLANIEPVQSGSGDPSPDNVRPISGWSAVNVWRTGKNLLDVANAIHNAYNIGSIPNTLKMGATYIFSINGTTDKKYRLYLAKSDNPLNALIALTAAYIAGGNSQTFTAPSVDGYDLLCIAGASNGAGNESLDNILPQLELGSTATAYEPYSGNQYTIQLGQTVYGGYISVGADGSAELVVTHAEVDLGDCTWITAEHYRAGLFGALITGIKRASSGQTTNAICSQYKTGITVSSSTDFSDFENGSLHGWRTNDYVYFYDTAFVGYTKDEVKSAMSGVQLVYELATPITIPLTPQEISTLQGQNVMWADTGDVMVEYLSAGGANPDLMKLAVAFMGKRQ